VAETGLFALASQGLVERHLLDLVVLAATGLVVMLRPRAAPYLVVLAVLLPSSATHALTSEGLVLAGAAIGLALDRLRRRDWAIGPWLTAPLLLLMAFDALMAMSALANPAATQATWFFVSRTVLVAAVVSLGRQGRWDWLAAAGIGTAVLGAARLLELGGVPVQALLGRLSIQLLGDVGQLGTWNVFAIVLAVGALAALGAVPARASRAVAVGGTGLVALVLLAAGTASSRTVLVAVLAVAGALVLIEADRRRRGALGALAAVFAAASFLPGASVAQKPLVLSAPSATAELHTATPPAGLTPVSRPTGTEPSSARLSPPQWLTPDWRSVVDRPYYRLDQTFVRPVDRAHDHVISFLARTSTKTAAIRLRVTVNGTRVAELGAADLDISYRWTMVAVPDAALAGGGDMTVSLAAVGELDDRRFFAIGGVAATAPDIRSVAFSQGRPVPDDLSADPGQQRGLLMVFLDGLVPALHRLPPAGRQVLQESISDRLTLWRTAWRVFLRHPLLGTGFYTFVSARQEDPQGNLFEPYANAHSNVLELLSDLGALGPLLYLALLASAAIVLSGWPPRLRGDDRWWRLCLAGAVAVMLVSGFTQTWLADSRAAVFFWVLLLVAGRYSRRDARIASGSTGTVSSPSG
jgi:O-Antigen ligase